MMARLKPYNCEPEYPWLTFSQKLCFILIVQSAPINVTAKTKMGHIKTIILTWLQVAQQFDVNGTPTSNNYKA